MLKGAGCRMMLSCGVFVQNAEQIWNALANANEAKITIVKYDRAFLYFLSNLLIF